MWRPIVLIVLTSCTSSGLRTWPAAPQTLATEDFPAQAAARMPALTRNEREPARIGPPAGRGAGSRHVATADGDRGIAPYRERVAEIDPASSLHGE